MGGSGATSPLSRRTSPPSHHPGHLLVPRGEVQAADLQNICVPVVGERHRLGPGPLLHALHPLHRPLQVPALQRLLAPGEGDAARDLLPPSPTHLSHPCPCPLLSSVHIQVPSPSKSQPCPHCHLSPTSSQMPSLSPSLALSLPAKSHPCPYHCCHPVPISSLSLCSSHPSLNLISVLSPS